MQACLSADTVYQSNDGWVAPRQGVLATFPGYDGPSAPRLPDWVAFPKAALGRVSQPVICPVVPGLHEMLLLGLLACLLAACYYICPSPPPPPGGRAIVGEGPDPKFDLQSLLGHLVSGPLPGGKHIWSRLIPHG